MRALVDDASNLAGQARGHAASIQQHRQHLNETREALMRCATVFSQVHGVHGATHPPYTSASCTMSWTSWTLHPLAAMSERLHVMNARCMIS